MAMDLDDIGDFFGKMGSGISRSFRGLICEKKDGKWELSKGNVSYWIVFGMMLKIWYNKGAQFTMPDLSKFEDAKGMNQALVGMQDVAAQIAASSDVPESMLYVWGALLGYAMVKTTKGGIARAAAAWKGGGLDNKAIAPQ